MSAETLDTIETLPNTTTTALEAATTPPTASSSTSTSSTSSPSPPPPPPTSNPIKSKLESIKKVYQRTPPFPCNWPQLLYMFAEIKILERETNDLATCPSASSTCNPDTTSNDLKEKRKLEIDNHPIEEQLQQLNTLRGQLSAIRNKYSDGHHQKYVELLEDSIVTKKFEPCVICLDHPQRPVLTPCGHIYCYECISAALAHYRFNRPFCPVCREDLEHMSDLVEIPRFKIVKVKPFPWPWNWRRHAELVLPIQQR